MKPLSHKMHSATILTKKTTLFTVQHLQNTAYTPYSPHSTVQNTNQLFGEKPAMAKCRKEVVVVLVFMSSYLSLQP